MDPFEHSLRPLTTDADRDQTPGPVGRTSAIVTRSRRARPYRRKRRSRDRAVHHQNDSPAPHAPRLGGIHAMSANSSLPRDHRDVQPAVAILPFATSAAYSWPLLLFVLFFSSPPSDPARHFSYCPSPAPMPMLTSRHQPPAQGRSKPLGRGARGRIADPGFSRSHRFGSPLVTVRVTDLAMGFVRVGPGPGRSTGRSQRLANAGSSA
jgi:hypothetical protein